MYIHRIQYLIGNCTSINTTTFNLSVQSEFVRVGMN